jgi:hypothetical protein
VVLISVYRGANKPLDMLAHLQLGNGSLKRDLEPEARIYGVK